MEKQENISEIKESGEEKNETIRKGSAKERKSSKSEVEHTRKRRTRKTSREQERSGEVEEEEKTAESSSLFSEDIRSHKEESENFAGEYGIASYDEEFSSNQTSSGEEIDYAISDERVGEDVREQSQEISDYGGMPEGAEGLTDIDQIEKSAIPEESEEKDIQEEEKLQEELSEEEYEGQVKVPHVKVREIPDVLQGMIEVDEKGKKYILLNKISAKSISEIIEIARSLGISDPTSFRRQELIAEIMNVLYTYYGVHLYAEGVFQMIDTGSGFIRFSHNNYLQSNDDVFVSKQMIKKYGMRTGDIVLGEIIPPSEDKGKYFSLYSVEKINFAEPRKARERTLFENLTPYYPMKKFNLDWQPDGDISCRVVDIIAPIGKGQRGLIVSPPRAGKTMLMQNIAKAILTNHPDVILIVLLIDERPEEVTDWKRNIVAKYAGERQVEVVSSTFDEKPENHIKVAEMVLAKAKRLVEYGYDVVIFLDSITRLTRAYNQCVPSSGKVLTGGIDSAALQFPKKFFGAARAIEDGGSLTILATCLIDTGSRMDEVIFEEFKGTGNMEVYLDRRIAEKRIFPAIDVHRSGTRREELLIPSDILPKVWLLRKVLQPMSTTDAMELLYEKMSKTRTNTEFFELLAKEG
ncbi:Transcription termination factor Rho [bacterium HR19]|nr:Transcription termination factor Rho [bacterium HR19]